MSHKAKALVASVLGLMFCLIYGFQELGQVELVKALFYAVVIAAPMMVVGYRYKAEMLKVPRYVMPVGVIIGMVAYKVLSRYSKTALISFALLAAILMLFIACIYNNDELDQTRGS